MARKKAIQNNDLKQVIDEEKKILAEERKIISGEKEIIDNERKIMHREVFKTIVFMVLIFVIALSAIYFSGVMDRDKEYAQQRAEFLCWKAGYYGGIDRFEPVKYAGILNQTYGKAYFFTCKGEKDIWAYMNTNWTGYVFLR